MYYDSYILCKDNLNLLKKTKRSLVDSYGKKTLSTYCTTTCTQCVPTLKNILYLRTFFQQNIPYLDHLSAFCPRLVSQIRATVKYHCTTYGTFSSAVRGRHSTAQFPLFVCSLEQRSLGFFGFVFGSVCSARL